MPDRISIEHGDPGEVAFDELRAGRLKLLMVLLDGVEQREVITADRAEGFVKRLVQPFMIVGDELKTEIVRGKVEFRIAGQP